MKYFVTTILALGICVASLTAQSSRPNFLVIIADDLGYSDLGAYGSEIATPNLDSLATNGLRFTTFYNTARCWPTRSALVSGYYPQQIRRDGMPGVDHRKFGGSGVRPKWARLVSERLREVGYRSYHSGKWHVDGVPTENGFDLSYESRGGSNFFRSVVHERHDYGPPPSEAERGGEYYDTVAVADHAIGQLMDHAQKHDGKPFFSYVAFHAPHFPLHALPEDIARYRDRYVEGWDQLRNERYERQRNVGLTDAKLSDLEPELGPPYPFPDAIEQLGAGEVNRSVPWKTLTPAQRRFQADKMAIHAAMIDRVDREIGRILDQVRAMKAFDDTLVLFLSDNGASAEIMVRGEGHDPELPMGSAKTYLCLGPGFATASNTPFRRHKTWVHEGGISTPFIAHWPKGILAKNQLRKTPAHVIDIAPTMLDLAGAKTEPDAGAPPFPGGSLARVFKGDGAPLHDAIWFYHEGNRGLRQGNWKIVHTVGPRTPWREVAAMEDARPGEWALYDLSKDRAEQEDLAAKHPDRVRSMAALWESWKNRFMRDSGESPGN